MYHKGISNSNLQKTSLIRSRTGDQSVDTDAGGSHLTIATYILTATQTKQMKFVQTERFSFKFGYNLHKKDSISVV